MGNRDMMTSNLGKWDRWYGFLAAGGKPIPYGSTETYLIGSTFFHDVDLVEDWGCGKGFLRTFLAPEQYRGIDGSKTPFADEIADLADYTSEADGIFLRHVLEHDYRWKQILANAAKSARSKIVVVLFTPLQDETREIAWNEDPGVPDLGFALDDLLEILSDFHVEVEEIDTVTQYGHETVLFGSRK